MAYTYSLFQVCRTAKRLGNTKRPYLYVNPLQGKHVPVKPSEAFRLFSELALRTENLFRSERLLAIGFAETATAIGAAVAFEARNVRYYMTTTREPPFRVPDAIAFQEAHSHAAGQWLAADGLEDVLRQVDRVVFIEDEVTTGNTIRRLMDGLRAHFPNLSISFGIVSVLNSMSGDELEAMRGEGVPVTWCHWISKGFESSWLNGYTYHDEDVGSVDFVQTYGMLRVMSGWNARRVCAAQAAKNLCDVFVSHILRQVLIPDGRLLVLGTEECMYPGLLLARAIEERYDTDVRFHATTRSPIEVSHDSGYPLWQRFRLESVYEAGRTTFVYNLERYDKVIIVTDARIIHMAGLDGLADVLAACGNRDIQVIQWREY